MLQLYFRNASGNFIPRPLVSVLLLAKRILILPTFQIALLNTYFSLTFKLFSSSPTITCTRLKRSSTKRSFHKGNLGSFFFLQSRRKTSVYRSPATPEDLHPWWRPLKNLITPFLKNVILPNCSELGPMEWAHCTAGAFEGENIYGILQWLYSRDKKKHSFQVFSFFYSERQTSKRVTCW